MKSQLPLKSGDIVFIATSGSRYRRVAKASHAGIVFEDGKGGWVVAESALRACRYRPLDRFLNRSDDNWFVVRRLERALSPEQVEALRAACDARIGKWYQLGFRYGSSGTYRSKFVDEVYREALGVDIGTAETFSELLRRNPVESPGLWKLWFSGRVPPQRKTKSAASRPRPQPLGSAWHSGGA